MNIGFYLQLILATFKIMTVEIDKNGLIIVSAETPLEAFALNEIIKKWDKPEDMQKSILIRAIASE